MMPLPYENASSGQHAVGDIQRVLTAFGCQGFGHYVDIEKGEVMIQFRHHGREVSVRASFRGYAVAWLKHNPHTNRMRISRTDHERKALEQASNGFLVSHKDEL